MAEILFANFYCKFLLKAIYFMTSYYISTISVPVDFVGIPDILILLCCEIRFL